MFYFYWITYYDYIRTKKEEEKKIDQMKAKI